MTAHKSQSESRPLARTHVGIQTHVMIENLKAAWRPILSLAFAASMIAGCAGGPVGGSNEAMQQSRAAAQSYRLAMGDRVHIAVFNEENLSGDYTVSPDGRITLPLAGPVNAAGRTVPEFQEAVISTLKNGFVQNPNVTITATELRPYFILGEVNKPGKYSYMPELTVMAAVATAEGFTYRADMGSIYVRHAADPSEREYPLTATMAVLPGDTIRISQRYF